MIEDSYLLLPSELPADHPRKPRSIEEYRSYMHAHWLARADEAERVASCGHYSSAARDEGRSRATQCREAASAYLQYRTGTLRRRRKKE